MIYDGLDRATLKSMLDDALAAHHKLMIGRSATVVSFDGSSSQSTTFTPAQLPRLREYIRELQVALGMRTTGRRAMRPNLHG